ncbi:MAG: hypothetical protein EBQ92_04470 [Proteobacteria bacterium]|nr:hypothetical protein [Pseudomonadota bacterium]
MKFDRIKRKRGLAKRGHEDLNLNQSPRKEQVLVLLIIGSFLWGTTASAGAPAMFQGTDKGRPCSLYVHREQEQAGVYEVEVSTSYEHNGQGLGKIVLTFDPNSGGKILQWQDPKTKEFLKVVLKNESESLSEPSGFRLKWMHFDHLHDATCSELKPTGAE